MSKKNWVDYGEVKAKISIKEVLDRYGVTLKKSGKDWKGCCPIHKGSNPQQFSVSFEKNAYNCFGNCKSGGNVLDFVASMEGVNVHQAGLLLQKWFLGGNNGKKKFEKKKERKEERGEEEKEEQKSENTPLDFQLKSIEKQHAFFERKKITEAEIDYFGLGYCKKGMMKDRVVIPIHNIKGELVAYCGRAVDEEQEKEDGKYKLPPDFLKMLEVYNLHRQTGERQSLIIVESFLTVWKFWSYGLLNTVALMGSVIGENQADLIYEYLKPNGHAYLLFDGDEDGQKCTKECLLLLGKGCFVKAFDVSIYEKKPHLLNKKQVFALLSGKA